MLKAAETAVLQNGGERLALTCPAGQKALRAALDRWPPSTVSRAGGRRVIQLIAPADDGLIQGDNDFRTPLRKITCPTCVEATLQSRTRRRLDAFRKREGARKMAAHSRLIAEAYAPRPDERRPHPEWAGPGIGRGIRRNPGPGPGKRAHHRGGARRSPSAPPRSAGRLGRLLAAGAARTGIEREVERLHGGGQGDADAERAGPKFFAGNAFSPVTRTVAALLQEENSLDV